MSIQPISYWLVASGNKKKEIYQRATLAYSLIKEDASNRPYYKSSAHPLCFPNIFIQPSNFQIVPIFLIIDLDLPTIVI